MKQTIMRMRRIIDLLMTLTLFFLMGYQLWGEAAHEWVGTVMGVLFLLHQWYNRRWYCTLTQGPWSLVRTFHMLVNLLSVLAMLALLASGVVLSSMFLILSCCQISSARRSAFIWRRPTGCMCFWRCTSACMDSCWRVPSREGRMRLMVLPLQLCCVW